MPPHMLEALAVPPMPPAFADPARRSPYAHGFDRRPALVGPPHDPAAYPVYHPDDLAWLTRRGPDWSAAARPFFGWRLAWVVLDYNTQTWTEETP